MAVWPWLRDELDVEWPTRCPGCAARLDVLWLTTTTRASDGVRRPGVGLLCAGCSAEYDWRDEGGYSLVRRRFGPGPGKPGERPKG